MVRRPDFMIIGAQKGGTTWIYKHLRRHPDAYMVGAVSALEKERCGPADFERFLRPGQHAAAEQRLGYTRVCMENSRAPERVHRASPDMKLIVSLRDPIARAVSSWYQGMTAGIIPIQHVEGGLEQLLDGAISTRWPLARTVLDSGLYHKHLQRWLEYYRRDQVLILLAEELRRHPQQSLQQVCRFVDLDVERLPSGEVKRSNPGVYSLAHQRYLRATLPLYRRRSRTADGYVNRRGPLAKLARAVCWSVISQRVLHPILKQPAPQLSDALQRQLAQFYRQDLIALESLLGRSLEHWPTMQLVHSMDAAPHSEHAAERAAADAGS